MARAYFRNARAWVTRARRVRAGPRQRPDHWARATSRRRLRSLSGLRRLRRVGPRLDPLRKLPLQETVLVDLPVDGAVLEQVVVRSTGDDSAAIEHHELARQRQRRQAVRDDDRRPPLHRLAKPEPN